MQVVILAGGLGTRISEETILKPKPMVEIGGMPILWHIMKIYYSFGFNDFIICLGYKGYCIKEFFANYHTHTSDITINTKSNSQVIHSSESEDWNVTLVNTGQFSMTGSRLSRVRKFLKADSPFCLTYGDGISNVNIAESVKFHKEHGRIATVTAVKSASRFGVLDIDEQKNDAVRHFKEKPEEAKDWINGGFFILSPEIFNYLDPESEEVIFEKEPLESLARDGQIAAFKHNGFWHSMDTLRDKNALEEMWQSNFAPWKLWK